MDLQGGKGGINEKTLLEKFQEFKADLTNYWAIKRQNIKLLSDELIIELFVADFRDESELLGNEYNIRYSPIARILKVGEYANRGISWWAKLWGKCYKELDFVYVEDLIVAQIESKNYLDYLKAKEHPNFNDQGPPPRFQKKIYQWVGEGFLFVPDKKTLCLDERLINFNSDFITTFEGPYVFKFPAAQFPVRVKDPFKA